jgi:hypothetical protein
MAVQLKLIWLKFFFALVLFQLRVFVLFFFCVAPVVVSLLCCAFIQVESRTGGIVCCAISVAGYLWMAEFSKKGT